jgi:hypothetical protein
MFELPYGRVGTAGGLFRDFLELKNWRQHNCSGGDGVVGLV